MNGNEMKSYRKSSGMTQTELAGMLNDALGTKYSKPQISNMERGYVGIPQNVSAYLADKIIEKAVITSSNERKIQSRVIMPCDVEKSLKSELSKKCYRLLREHSINDPLIASEVADSEGVLPVNVRIAIREIRMAHVRVCSDPAHRGYWLDENGGGYDITRKQMLSRAFKLLEVVRAMDDAKEGQYEWVEGLG